MKLPLYFISDIHLKLTLDKDEKDRRQNLYRLLDRICVTGGTCFFVGDLFDFYFEYPDVIPKAYVDFYEKASHMKKSGVDIHFKTGNHDYWFLDFLEQNIMTKVYTDDIDVMVNGKRFFITHGDGILSWDHGYRVLKRVIRSKVFITLFRWIHPTIAYKIAKFISRSGKEDMHGADFNKDVKNELQIFAKEQFDKGFDYMISGHYHLGEIYNLDKGKLAVLGDWFHRPSYAKFDGEDLSMNLWEENV